MRRNDDQAHQGLLREPLSLAQKSDYTRGISQMSSDGIESTFDHEPNVPLTFVACIHCGSLTDLHAPTCPDCEQPRPQRVPPTLLRDIRCVRCGDAEIGPWLDADDGLICETCDEEAA